jgi:transposase
MRQREKQAPQSAEETVRDIRRATRRHFSAEDKIRIVLEGLRGEDSVAELCRKEGIAQNLYYRWSKEFLEAGKKRLAGDTAREATSDEVKTLRAEARQLKEALAEATLENRLHKASKQQFRCSSCSAHYGFTYLCSLGARLSIYASNARISLCERSNPGISS